MTTLDERLAREQAEQRLPSIVAGVVRGGELLWQGHAGDGGGPDVQYRIGSITKTFVAVLVLRLRDEGAIELDDRLEEHLPGLGPLGRATVADLLAHASGLRAESAGDWWERTPGRGFGDLARSTLGADGVRARPGRRFHYSNPGFGVLGELVARRRGTPWQDVLQAEVLEPLGMHRTNMQPSPPHARGVAVHPWAEVVQPEPAHDAGAMAPAGQLWSTLEDQARWASFLAGDTGGVLDPATVEEMCEPQVVVDQPGAPWTGAHGLGVQLWNVQGRRSHGHTGSMPGFVAIVRVDAETKDGFVAMASCTAGWSLPFVGEMLDLVERAPKPAWAPSHPGDDVLEIVGPWYWGPTPFVLKQDGDVLDLSPLGAKGRSSRFRPAADGTWRGLDGYYADEDLRVVRRDDGSVVRLDIATFAFTRTPYDPAGDVPGGVESWGA